jgi:hypothetical protein
LLFVLATEHIVGFEEERLAAQAVFAGRARETLRVEANLLLSDGQALPTSDQLFAAAALHHRKPQRCEQS